jgi:hypothetical protein
VEGVYARNLVKSFGALLGLAWLLVPLGAKHVKALAPYKKRFIAFALIPPFIAPLWGHVGSRIYYPIAPVFLLLAVIGLFALPKALRLPAFIAALVFNVVALLCSLPNLFSEDQHLLLAAAHERVAA